ncbi:hypothetical protein N7478_003721 [Penicillium angulare]|uniref:uncharacterized protein n=1 Tax=Penicillium angulare TaxID=116970 RepID=UPI0025419C49|nr:uncharacterized protein N7478_003721 [Penicillium angulare]KAJ5288035.1 hypothetical protein N7478_003721 [Penicillium angulare]
MTNAPCCENNAGRPLQPTSQLGLVVAPGEIRLKPQPKDGYAWSVTPEKAYLFDTSLGIGNVGFYQTICKKIGRSLEAVLPPQEVQTDLGDLSPGQQTPKGSRDSGSFTAKIHDLESAKRDLRLDLDRTRADLEECSGKNSSLQDRIDELQNEITTAVSRAVQLESDLARTRKCIAITIELLQAHDRQDAGVTSEEITEPGDLMSGATEAAESS